MFVKSILFYKLETFSARVLAPILRSTGQKIYKRALLFQGDLVNEDRLVPSLRCIPISDAKYPRLLDVSSLYL